MNLPLATWPELLIIVPGNPVAWARAGRGRGARAGGKYVTFTPAKQRNWKELCQAYMAQARGSQPLYEAPLLMEVRAYWPRPKSIPKREGTGSRWRPSRPDSDNVGKQVADAAIGVLYADDALVVRLVVEKRVAAAGDGPRVEISVRPVEGA